MFVDSLLIYNLHEFDIDVNHLENNQEPTGAACASPAQLLSGITRMAGVVSTPTSEPISGRSSSLHPV